MRSYHELMEIPKFEDRVKYLMLDGAVGVDTFGFDRYLNQMFYRDGAWKRIRRDVILRDNGCDLGCEDRPILGFIDRVDRDQSGQKKNVYKTLIIVHHIIPMTKEDILSRNEMLLNPDNLICCSPETHRLIHYGAEADICTGPAERRPFDTCPWRTKVIGEVVSGEKDSRYHVKGDHQNGKYIEFD